MFKDLIFAGLGYLFGAFTPGVLRQLKSLFVKKSTAAVAAAPASVQTAVKAVEAEAKKL